MVGFVHQIPLLAELENDIMHFLRMRESCGAYDSSPTIIQAPL